MKTTNLYNFIEKKATENMRFKKISNEFSFLILIFIFLKLLTSFVSILAGYTYLNNTILKIIQNGFFAVSITLITLFLIEFITQISLQRLFKFGLKRQLNFMIIMFIVVVLFFALSSFLSLKGIAIITSKKVDLTSQIINKYKVLEQSKINEFKDKISYQKSQIDLIKKQTWKGKLSSQNINRINELNDLIIKIEIEKNEALTKLTEEKNKDLTKNNQGTQSNVKEYFFIVLIIMFLQLLSNLFLNYFYFLIFKERADYFNDFVKNEQSEIKRELINVYQDIFNQNNNDIINGLKLSINANKDIDEIQSEPVQRVAKATEHTDTEKLKTFGFNKALNFNNEKSTREKIKENTTGINKNETKINETRINETRINEKNGIRICKNCGAEFVAKHNVQKYCSEKCRIEFWENEKGKKLIYKKLKK